MHFVITGATGHIGRDLVPLLAARGARLLLVGRDRNAVAAMFPDHEAIGWEDLADRDLAGATLVHLAVVNTHSGAADELFRAGNVEFLLATARAAQAAGVARFVNLSSTHALDPANESPYARSKREGAAALAAEVPGLSSVTLYLPAVHGRRFSGKLARLNGLPPWLARGVFICLAALKPVVSVERLAAVLVEGVAERPGEPAILVDDIGRNPVYRGISRGIDVLAGLGIMVGLSWLLLLIWVLVRRESAGPGLFLQTRIGRYGRPFTCVKFRTMAEGTPEVGTHDAPAAAVTRIGAKLRATKLDELPQAWNLLKGEMALIGPRPCLPVQKELIAARRVRGVLAVRPGISGLAQVQGIDMSDPERLAKCDARYVALRGLLLDLRLMLATLRGGGRGDRVRG